MFCIHKWKEIKTERFNSLMEGRSFEEVSGTFLIDKLTKRGIITVVKCEKCGEIKHIRTEL